MRVKLAWSLVFALLLAILAAAPRPPAHAAEPPGAVIDGRARFTVLTPTLVRMEYSATGSFEDRPTFNAVNRHFTPPPYSTSATHGERVIRTDRLTLRYRRGSGPFGPTNLTVELTAADRPVSASPFPVADQSPTQLGGWYRGLDRRTDSQVRLHRGILDRAGWSVLDDSATALLDADGGITQRPGGTYQDGYFFGYGHDYRTALRDFTRLSGPTALLPRAAYGVWYSRYHGYSLDDYRKTLLPAFRSNRVPLDELVVDTDYKDSGWNGWGWNRSLLPDPAALFEWARAGGLDLVLNVHPSIQRSDPRFSGAQTAAGGSLKPCTRSPGGADAYCFDWSDPRQAKAYFDLHGPYEQLGPLQWWFDWCHDSSEVSAAGVTPDSYLNQLYAQHARSNGRRGYAFSRIGSSVQNYDGEYPAGAWAEHRNTLHFTADTYGRDAQGWDSLRLANRTTIGEGAIALSNVSHDIGSYEATRLPGDEYVRWVQFGAFQPVLRLHSVPDGERLPWEYPGAAGEAAEQFLRLRHALLPYTYTLAREARDTGLPIVRAMYLNWPEAPEAYTDTQFTYGDDVLVAPILTPDSGGEGSRSVWFPPGTWVNHFTGERVEGPVTRTVTASWTTMPVYVRAGAVLTTQPYADNDDHPWSTLELTVATGDSGSGSVYEDAGQGPGYTSGESAVTALSYQDTDRSLTIAPRQGGYPGAVGARSWVVHFRDAGAPPAEVTVDGTPVSGYEYDAATGTLTVRTAALPVDAPTTVAYVPATPQSRGHVVGSGRRWIDACGGHAGRPVHLEVYGPTGC